jgi:hypothetical protein
MKHILSAVIAREGGDPVSQRPHVDTTTVSGILDRPVKPDDDTEFVV